MGVGEGEGVRVGGEGGGLGHTLISYQLPAELRGGG